MIDKCFFILGSLKVNDKLSLMFLNYAALKNRFKKVTLGYFIIFCFNASKH